MNKSHWILIFFIFTTPILTYFAGYRIGFNDGCRETTVIAVEAIREVKESGVNALHELAMEVGVAQPSIEIPASAASRELNPGEIPVQGMVPVISEWGDWYDGVNYYDSKRGTSTLMGSLRRD